MQSIEDAGSGDERATTGWEKAFALIGSSGAFVLRHENRAKSLALGNRQVLEWVSNSDWAETARSADRNSSSTQAAAAAAGGLAKEPWLGQHKTQWPPSRSSSAHRQTSSNSTTAALLAGGSTTQAFCRAARRNEQQRQRMQRVGLEGSQKGGRPVVGVAARASRGKGPAEAF